MNATVGCAGPGSNDGPGFRSQAVDPIAGKDRLAGFLIGPKGRPVPVGLILFVRNRSFDHQNERGEVTCGCAMKRLQEVFAGLVGEAWIMEIYFGNPGYATEKNILEAWLRGRGHGNGIAVTAKSSGNPEHIHFGEGWRITRWMVARHSGDSNV
jgi:hypothetical protein